MDLQDNWPPIKATFEAALKSSLHCAIGTVGSDGYPHITPIGFIFLREDQSAFYFEEYSQRIPQNLEHNPRVCLLLVNSRSWFWVTALFRGRFASPPGMRLRGVAGARRLATEAEKAAYRARVRSFRRLRGYDLIWRDLLHVRDIQLHSVEPVLYPKMTDGLWV
ncbi:MAG: pyridoxamine-5-phosphate oxidase-related FMN-binding protein [Myxococcaceae bacterium]|nr:pyridoxamine-5-phosphate oxidase-related FMN-binding protein [Myxococcaceae bacterium]